ncbi:unnamed protein product [Rotaria sordida]|uniref:Tudor domain-containing protein n=1 Tax=Rotaria sordida TaxID=392033 RepID=A0A819DER0_9BILA|nr:unnamed protein product [Rotaria sordida]CAF3832517.1 unnamed protein product [Rotaria sordida]
MQRPVRGYRGGSRISAYLAHTHGINDNGDNDHERSSLSNSNLGETEDDNNDIDITIKSKNSSVLSSIAISTDFESVIRSLQPLAIRQKKPKNNSNINSQKADLPQLNMISDTTNTINEQTKDQPTHHWFPKPDVGHVKSNDFIRHNHIESQQIGEQFAPPALLTTMPPADILTRPTAIIAQAAPTRSISTYLLSNSSTKNVNNKIIDDFQTNSILKSNQQSTTSFLKQTSSSAFQPINSIQNLSSNIISRQKKIKSQPILIDIPKHKALERGQKLTKVHISHPQSPSIVNLMLHEDFNRACCLLHTMSIHPELQTDYIPSHPFKPAINKICACFHEGRWFRCRILQISEDLSTATVIYLDWGMVIPVQITPTYIRRLPNEFYMESICSIMCHLDGVSNSNDLIPSSIIAQCINLLSENEYDVIVNDYHSVTGGKIILSYNGQIINDQIQKLIIPYKLMSGEEELIEQFQYELQLSVGDELKALLSSFSGKDDSFYVLVINENTAAIDRAMSELQEDHIPNREYLQVPQIKTLVVARYADDKKYYRAWVTSVDIEHEQAIVFFVDFGNESTVLFSDIYTCPESVRLLPWLGIRVRLTNETMTAEELTTFWKLTESHYVWIRINEIFKDSYGIQIKIDYTVYLQQERLKMVTSKRFINKAIQTKTDEKFIYPRNSSEKNLCLSTPSKIDQIQIGNENFLRNLFEMINNELRSVRHRINGSDEASQDRHDQLMQLLFSIVNSNNSNNQKKIC